MMKNLGFHLYIVPTPIGNMDDMTYRAIEVLKFVDIILAEDTRTSGKLLKHFDITTKMWSHHRNNESKSITGIIQALEEGKNFALISDAGTPLISDPGYIIVKSIIERGFKVTALPGATAFVPGLVTSGFDVRHFIFEGFLPLKKGRKTRLLLYVNSEYPVVFYESPYRIKKVFKEFNTYYNHDRKVCVCKEISKLHEQTWHSTVGNLNKLQDDMNIKGEFILILDKMN